MVKINTFSLFYIISVGLLIGAMLSLSPKVYANNEKLEQIQKEIENHKKLIEKKQNDFNELKKQLEKDQEEFHQISEQLKRSKQKLSDTKDQIKKLEKEQLDLLEKKDNQLQILKIQLSEAYKLGKNDYIKLILNQQNPNQIGRILEYYHYISVARIEIIKEIDTISNLIRQNHEELVKNNQKLQQIVKEHNNNADQYKIKQKKTTETLIAINKSIQNEEQTLKNLKKAEQNLLNSIAENQRLLEEKRKKQAEEELKQVKIHAKEEGKSQTEAEKEFKEKQEREKLSGFEKLKGNLVWPANGKILKKYGDSRAGELKWMGLLIRSKNQQVKAIAKGDIVLATELSGYGFIIAIDHGDGYISLYGNNRDNLKKVGDRVYAGELIAYTDNDSYQLDGALYFEIRHKGKSVNPSKWLRKRK
jgi:septal ring factor EnvC (AmiA/AmiB activator)